MLSAKGRTYSPCKTMVSSISTFLLGALERRTERPRFIEVTSVSGVKLRFLPAALLLPASPPSNPTNSLLHVRLIDKPDSIVFSPSQITKEGALDFAPASVEMLSPGFVTSGFSTTEFWAPLDKIPRSITESFD
ncbi:delta1-pyrroline-5-carboxylate synthase 1 [Striga asiatica]|uniref:Delta1-pyrroline-5-carboxylate synthase 1 n=1 Tax=Striga asiatica TaxID=4170 RepID=A0A5A7R0W9_STRAF|nr:delta1-pyrroline-5-carboxylate synthase 1 [Striga asiatica]